MNSQKKNKKKITKRKGRKRERKKEHMLAGHAFFLGMCACTCARVCAHARMVLVEECAHENGAAVCVENSRLLRHHRWQVWFLKKKYKWWYILDHGVFITEVFPKVSLVEDYCTSWIK